MNRDDIISMARESGFDDFFCRDLILERFAAMVATHEREECAKLCDKLQSIPATEPRHCAEDIRARSEKLPH